jgi:hypothetical protein
MNSNKFQMPNWSILYRIVQKIQKLTIFFVSYLATNPTPDFLCCPSQKASVPKERFFVTL